MENSLELQTKQEQTKLVVDKKGGDEPGINPLDWALIRNIATEQIDTYTNWNYNKIRRAHKKEIKLSTIQYYTTGCVRRCYTTNNFSTKHTKYCTHYSTLQYLKILHSSERHIIVLWLHYHHHRILWSLVSDLYFLGSAGFLLCLRLLMSW